MNELRCNIQLGKALDLPGDLIVQPNGDDSRIARIVAWGWGTLRIASLMQAAGFTRKSSAI
jgi:hypothetical protein